MKIIYSIIILFLPLLLLCDNMQSKGKIKTANISNSGIEKDISKNVEFSGNVIFNIDLFSIGMIDIKLQYSSSVKNNVRSDNKLSPTSTVGLGWSLDLPSIVGQINGTIDTLDDRYYYDGVEVLQDTNGIFYVQNNEPWKILRELNSKGEILGWIVINEDGTKYRFGNYDKDSNMFFLDYTPTNASRYYLGFYGWVSNPLPSEYDSAMLIPYRWDLSDIEDINGNHTSVIYNQDKIQLVNGSKNTSIKYTRESHVSMIKDNSGGCIEFKYGVKNNTEYTGDSESYNQNVYEKLYLDSIVFVQSEKIYQSVNLDYQLWDTLHIGATKRYLTAISLSDNHKINKTINQFTYYGIESDNPGALKEVHNLSGLKKKYIYKVQKISNVKLDFRDTSVISFSSHCSNISRNSLSYLSKTGLSGKDFFVEFGRTNLMVSQEGLYNSECKNYQKIRVYVFGATGWYCDSSFNKVSGFDSAAYCFVGNDYVLVNNFALIKRTPIGWKRYDLNNKLIQAGGTIGSYGVCVIGSGPDYIVLKHNRRPSGVNYLNDVSVVKIFPNKIQIDTVGKDYYDYSHFNEGTFPYLYFGVKADCGSNYFIITSYMNNGYSDTHYKWMNGRWVNLMNKVRVQNITGIMIPVENPPDYMVPTRLPEHSIGANYIVTTVPNDHIPIQCPDGVTGNCFIEDLASSVTVYSHTGKTLVKIDSLKDVPRIIGSQVFDKFVVIRGEPTVGSTTFIKKWKGNGLDTSSIEIGAGYFGTSVVGIRDRIFYTNNYQPSNLGGLHLLKKSNYDGDNFIIGSTIDSSYTYSPYGDRFSGVNIIDQNMFVFEWVNRTAPYYSKLKSYYYYGESLKTVLIDSISTHYENSYRYWQSGDRFIASVDDTNQTNLPFNTRRIISAFYCGFDSLGTVTFQGSPWDIVVDKQVVYNGENDSLLYQYSFENGVFDENMHNAKYNIVKIFAPGNSGRIVSYYYNDLDSTDMIKYHHTLNAQELDGKKYRQEIYSATDTIQPISEKIYYYDAALVSDSTLCLYRVQLDSMTQVKSGISTTTCYQYNTTNQQPTIITEKVGVTNAGGTNRDKVTLIEYAFEKHETAMNEKHMLVQPFEQIIAEKKHEVLLSDIVVGDEEASPGSSTVNYTTYLSPTNQIINIHCAILGGGSVEIGTSYGSSNIFTTDVSVDGSFEAKAGTTYYIKTSAENYPNTGNISFSMSGMEIISRTRSFYSNAFNTNLYQNTSTKHYNGTNWITTDSVISRGSYGEIKESENISGVRTTIKYGYNNTVPISTIVNATDAETKVEICQKFNSVTGGSLADNFSIYNPLSISLMLSSATRGNTDNCQKIVTGYSETSPVGIYINTGNLNSAKNYVIEFDFMVSEGTMEVYTSSGSTNLSQSVYSASSYKKKWHHGKILWNLAGNGSNSKVYFRSQWADQETFAATYYLDNVRIYPADAFCTSQTFDPVTLQVISATDENGVTRYATTDGFGRATTVLK